MLSPDTHTVKAGAFTRIDATNRLFAGLIVATFAIGLIVDRFGGLMGQVGVGVWTWLLLLRLIHTMAPRSRVPFYACLVWATAGEVFLSLIWGLYAYRLGNIPFFVPPGHVLLFWLGLAFAPSVSVLFVRCVAALAIVYSAYALYTGLDTISAVLAGLFLLCWSWRDGRPLFSLMLVIALMLELYGTWVGNWVWQTEVPYLGLTSNNPPLAAGAFYCVLDVLVAMSVWALGAARPKRQPA